MSALFDLSGRVVLVTGGTRGIGRAVVEQVVAHGARVAFCSRSEPDCATLARQLNAAAGAEVAMGIAADISDLEAVQAFVDGAAAKWGRIDGLVANAAELSYRGPPASTPAEKFERLLDVNVHKTFRLCHMVVPHMKERRDGAIVLITSHGAFRTNPTVLAYSVSKAAETQMARCLAAELAPFNIRVNCVAPGLTRTSGSRPVWEDEAVLAQAAANIPLGRISEPVEQAAAVIYLLSPGGSFVSGITITVDGGAFEKGVMALPVSRPAVES